MRTAARAWIMRGRTCGASGLCGRLAMMLAMRGVVLALLVLCTVPDSHSPTMCIEYLWPVQNLEKLKT